MKKNIILIVFFIIMWLIIIVLKISYSFENRIQNVLIEGPNLFPTSYEQRPTRKVTTSVLLNSKEVNVKGEGITLDDNIITISNDGVYEFKGKYDGSIIVDSKDDDTVEIVLSGVEINSESANVIYVKNAKEMIITLSDDTINTLNDKQLLVDDVNAKDAVIYSKISLNIGGGGLLNVNSLYKNGISVEDALIIENGIFIIKSDRNGLRSNHSITILDGTFDITAKDDGIKSGQEKNELPGYILINDGNFTIAALNDAIQSKSLLLINNGVFNITTNGDNQDGKSQKGLKSEISIEINNGKYNINTIDDAIHSNDSIIINDGSFEIKTKDDGIHADNNVEINNGNINMLECFEGIEGHNIRINNGEIKINSSDDAFNSPIPDQGEMYDDFFSIIEINGGKIDIISGDDGFDIDLGDLYLNGGSVLSTIISSDDTSSPIDVAGKIHLNGGNFFGSATLGHSQVAISESIVPELVYYFSNELTSDNEITILNNEGEVIYKYKPIYNIRYFLIINGKLNVGDTYNINVQNYNDFIVTMDDKVTVASENNHYYYENSHFGWYLYDYSVLENKYKINN